MPLKTRLSYDKITLTFCKLINSNLGIINQSGESSVGKWTEKVLPRDNPPEVDPPENGLRSARRIKNALNTKIKLLFHF